MEPDETRGCAADLLDSAGVTTPPIDIAAVAAHCDLPIRYRSDLPAKVSGFLYCGPVRDVIVVNAHHSRVRQRFTIAHEIGHWYFDDPSLSFKGIHRDYSTYPERGVDLFAAELLMPRPLLLEQWSSCTDPSTLAGRFQVSRGAMIRRLHEVGLTPEMDYYPAEPFDVDFSDPAWEV